MPHDRIRAAAKAFGGLWERSLSWNDKVNAGTKTANCTSTSQ